MTAKQDKAFNTKFIDQMVTALELAEKNEQKALKTLHENELKFRRVREMLKYLARDCNCIDVCFCASYSTIGKIKEILEVLNE